MTFPPSLLSRYLFFIALCLLFLSNVADAADAPSDPVGFTDYASRAFSKALPDFSVSIGGPLTLAIKASSGWSFQLSLDSIYSYCSRNRDSCDQAVASYVAKSSGTIREAIAPPDRSLLRVAVRPASLVDQLRQAFKNEPVATRVAGNLWAVCVIDHPQALQYLKPDQLAVLALSLSDAVVLCEQNTLASLRPMASVIHEAPPGSIGTIFGDPYESSRLALLESWAPVAQQMGGHLLVSVPGVDKVLYADERGPNAVDAVATLARDVARKTERPLSTAVFRWTATGWQIASP